MVYVCSTDAGVSDQSFFASFNINSLFAKVGGMIRLLVLRVCACVVCWLHEDYEGSEVL